MQLSFKHARRAITVGTMLAMVATLAFALTIASADGAVHPHMVDTTLAPGESVVVDKIVDTPEIPPKPDICFLADTTGSMGGAIANVQANATAIMTSCASRSAGRAVLRL